MTVIGWDNRTIGDIEVDLLIWEARVFRTFCRFDRRGARTGPARSGTLPARAVHCGRTRPGENETIRRGDRYGHRAGCGWHHRMPGGPLPQ
ncbi:hypothetical protein Athai_38210 [Actinocatenispora thailandica]|uniref:Uncharacterized protein n=1 Tax=Actinocatenispora thailandica TaxID=227318 RepID=A0A7R7HXT9_9ACTN|nr:hypothetical protein Athai_38210 [Actinocatenispora thailandica]